MGAHETVPNSNSFNLLFPARFSLTDSVTILNRSLVWPTTTSQGFEQKQVNLMRRLLNNNQWATTYQLKAGRLCAWRPMRSRIVSKDSRRHRALNLVNLSTSLSGVYSCRFTLTRFSVSILPFTYLSDFIVSQLSVWFWIFSECLQITVTPSSQSPLQFSVSLQFSSLSYCVHKMRSPYAQILTIIRKFKELH